jgi:hypothetical protein
MAVDTCVKEVEFNRMARTFMLSRNFVQAGRRPFR